MQDQEVGTSEPPEASHSADTSHQANKGLLEPGFRLVRGSFKFR